MRVLLLNRLEGLGDVTPEWQLQDVVDRLRRLVAERVERFPDDRKWQRTQGDVDEFVAAFERLKAAGFPAEDTEALLAAAAEYYRTLTQNPLYRFAVPITIGVVSGIALFAFLRR